MTLYLGIGNLIVCADHKHLADIVDHTPMTPEQIAQRAPCDECMICATPSEPNRRCEYEPCGKLLHDKWPGLYCSQRCAWKDAQ